MRVFSAVRTKRHDDLGSTRREPRDLPLGSQQEARALPPLSPPMGLLYLASGAFAALDCAQPPLRGDIGSGTAPEMVQVDPEERGVGLLFQG